MANLSATMWNDLQDTNATNEKRFSELGVINAVKDSTPATNEYISPSARKALQEASSLRNVKIPVLKDQTVTVNATPGFQFIPANIPDSDQYSFTAVDVFSGFRHYPALYANNTIDSDWAARNIMKNVAYAMGNTIEGLLTAQMDLRRTQVLNFTTQVSQGAGTFAFNAGTDVLEVSKAAQKETMFHNLEYLMAANELPGNYRLITSRAGLAVQRSEARKYGAGNQENKQALGFWTEDNLYESGNISAGSDIFQGYMLRDGAMGIHENFPYDFRAGTKIDGREWSISDMEIPFTRMRANIYVNNAPTEATALVASGVDSNLKMTHFQEMGVWIRFYIVYRYNSDLATRPNDIVKITGLTT